MDGWRFYPLETFMNKENILAFHIFKNQTFKTPKELSTSLIF